MIKVIKENTPANEYRKQVKVLRLDFSNHEINKIDQKEREYLSKYVNLLVLSINNSQLKTCANLVVLKSLQILDLKCNQIESIRSLRPLKTLVSLDLSHNNIDSIEDLEPLKDLPKLKNLDIKFNKVAEHKGVSKFLKESLDLETTDMDKIDEGFLQSLLDNAPISNANQKNKKTKVKKEGK